jgi:HPt (histidine-containing phosphotransfer) domain-containing protein
LRDEIGPEEFADVVELFLAETDRMVDALAAAPPAEYEERLHALKGTALNLGLAAFATLCRAGEAEAAAGRAEAVSLAPVLTTYARTRAAFVAGLAESGLA